ncbi:MAG: entericidin EcnAB [Sphingomonas sp. SCN 67-18]|nr:entericidin A/B family lipoprotein [Sphingomonas sp. SCN 67-18]ODU21455.1 MAG: entericidin EcnAB [Sphingomonas sp. SCN 67-18]
MRKLTAIACLASMIALSACNTISGMGRDVSSVGKTVSKTADGAK